MKITVFNGSPKGKNSNTHVIVDAFLKGAEEAGAETENVFLIERDIRHCTGCFSCWFKTPGKCVLRDDMDTLLSTYLRSDVVVYATPVYLWNMTACLKNFLDRLIPTMRPKAKETDGHYDMEKGPSKLPDTVIISNAGFPGDNNFQTMKEVVKTALPVLEIYRNCGMILKRREGPIGEKIAQYLEFVRQAGHDIAKKEKPSPETMKGLSMEILSVPEYLKILGG